MKNQVTFAKVQTGIFDVLLNGEKTEYQIINGSLGMTGRDTVNMYGITNSTNQSVRWFGPLVTCKKAITHTLNKRTFVAVDHAGAVDNTLARHARKGY